MWEYRLVRKTEKNKVKKEYIFYQFFEVYYDEQGNIESTDGPISIQGITFIEILSEIRKLVNAIQRPILDYDELQRKIDNKLEKKPGHNIFEPSEKKPPQEYDFEKTLERKRKEGEKFAENVIQVVNLDKVFDFIKKLPNERTI